MVGYISVWAAEQNSGMQRRGYIKEGGDIRGTTPYFTAEARRRGEKIMAVSYLDTDEREVKVDTPRGGQQTRNEQGGSII